MLSRWHWHWHWVAIGRDWLGDCELLHWWRVLVGRWVVRGFGLVGCGSWLGVRRGKGLSLGPQFGRVVGKEEEWCALTYFVAIRGLTVAISAPASCMMIVGARVVNDLFHEQLGRQVGYSHCVNASESRHPTSHIDLPPNFFPQASCSRSLPRLRPSLCSLLNLTQELGRAQHTSAT